jgi:hypothetical protein
VAYEAFERQSIRIEEPAIAIAPDGKISLNAAATRLFEEAKIQAVKILWDKAKCGIALQAVPRNDASSFSIAFGDRHSQATITAKTFLRYIGWAPDRRQTVRAKWNAQQKMLEAELPARFIKARGDTQGEPGRIPRDLDDFGGNENNRQVAERIAKDRSIIANRTPAKLSRERSGS